MCITLLYKVKRNWMKKKLFLAHNADTCSEGIRGRRRGLGRTRTRRPRMQPRTDRGGILSSERRPIGSIGTTKKPATGRQTPDKMSGKTRLQLKAKETKEGYSKLMETCKFFDRSWEHNCTWNTPVDTGKCQMSGIKKK
ncbi:uncharacterized protein [Drosophila pseudoobscura]|uniref:Uncharacterized protein isoform X5 n=1 Tax=Drosophila pseudoobscura pseudoobscura TaxID=46245 RepID=A0A6I8VQ87_DROPS|nr:uncharacterized protein LOC26533523 isoform X5 [Drosophila pseudoobscura]